MKRIAALIALGLAPGLALAFEFTSPEVPPGSTLDHRQVYNGFGCDGENISPRLVWKDAPADTRSFAVTVFDPDAPTGSGWWHWVIFNIPKNVNELPANAGNPKSGLAPKGSVQSLSDFGKPGFGGACPPVGDKPHRYIFTLYALKVDKLPLDKSATPAMVSFSLNANSLARASFTARYGR
jgi:Raf kinase inhibitor-like YbhB/YbcL family protein